MTINVKDAKLIDSIGRQRIERSINEILKTRRHIDTVLSDSCDIKGKNITISCPDNIQKHTVTLKLKPDRPSNYSLNFNNIERVSLKSGEDLESYDRAITINEDSINITNKILPIDETLLLEVECRISDQKFMHSLVNRKVAQDSPYKDGVDTDGVREYWLNAELTQPALLKHGNRFTLDVRDFDLDVDVSIGHDIKTKIPGQLQDQMEARTQLGKPMGRSEAFKATMRYQTLSRGKYGGKHEEILRTLQGVFTESSFKEYIEVKNQFKYHRSFRGREYYDKLPIQTWPQFMNVISRTDLSVDNPAADGILTYKRRNFMKEIANILGLKEIDDL